MLSSPHLWDTSPAAKVWTNLDNGNKDWGGADGYWRARCSALGGFVRPWKAATPFPEARHKSIRQVLRSSHFIDKSMETPRFTSFVHPCEAELEMEARLAGCRRCTGSRLVGRRACLVRRIVGGGCSRYSVVPPLWGAHTLKNGKALIYQQTDQ